MKKLRVNVNFVDVSKLSTYTIDYSCELEYTFNKGDFGGVIEYRTSSWKQVKTNVIIDYLKVWGCFIEDFPIWEGSVRSNRGCYVKLIDYRRDGILYKVIGGVTIVGSHSDFAHIIRDLKLGLLGI